MPHTHGIMDCICGVADAFAASPHPETLFDHLARVGYRNAYFGKWHLGSRQPENTHHWDAFNSAGGHWVDGKQDFQGGHYLPERQTDRMRVPAATHGGHAAVLCRAELLPATRAVHSAETVVDLYRGKGIFRPGYYGAVTAIDDYVGQILATLDEMGVRENTVVLYTSDHGEHFNYRAKNNKTTGHDDSIRIPMILSWPGTLPSARVVQGAAGLEDVVPTLLELCDVATPGDLHGKSLAPLATGARTEGAATYYVQNVEDFRSYAEWEVHMAGVYPSDSRSHFSPTKDGTASALWTRTHKLALSEHGDHLLYDLAQDPEEELNIYGAPKGDIFNQYGHYADQHDLMRDLIENFTQHSEALQDDLGYQLADLAIAQLKQG